MCLSVPRPCFSSTHSSGAQWGPRSAGSRQSQGWDPCLPVVKLPSPHPHPDSPASGPSQYTWACSSQLWPAHPKVTQAARAGLKKADVKGPAGGAKSLWGPQEGTVQGNLGGLLWFGCAGTQEDGGRSRHPGLLKVPWGGKTWTGKLRSSRNLATGGLAPGLGKGCPPSVMVTLDSPGSDPFVPAWRGRPE